MKYDFISEKIPAKGNYMSFLTAMKPQVSSKPPAGPGSYPLKPIRTLTVILYILLSGIIIVCLPDIVSYDDNINALQTVQQRIDFIEGTAALDVPDDVFNKAIDTFETAESNEVPVSLAIGLYLSYTILFFIWLWRCASNVITHASGTVDFTRAQSVSHFFIPILNIWKPYMWVTRIRNLSKNPDTSAMKTFSFFILFWWIIELIDLVLGRAAFKLNFRLSRMEEPPIDLIKRAMNISFYSDIATVASSLMAIVLICEIYSSQKKWVNPGLLSSIDSSKKA